MARKGAVKVAAVSIEVPPDERRRGPLTSDDRSFWAGNDATRGGQIGCSGVMQHGKKGLREIWTVNARELNTNPYGIGESIEGEEYD